MIRINKNTNIDFYIYTKKKLEELSKQKCITNIELQKYFDMTDFQYNIFNNIDKDSISFVFAQICFHGQNATLMSNIIKFDDKYEYWKKLTYNFSPKIFFKKYGNDKNKILNKINSDKEILWKRHKSIKPDVIINRYIDILINASNYLKAFSNKNEVLLDLKKQETDDPKNIIEYFMSKNKSGFSVALTCDFLKEFDVSFSYLAKPDIHIRDVIGKLIGKKLIDSKNNSYLILNIMKNIVDDVNFNDINEKLTVYKLDRMIRLICSNNFFLHDNKHSKEEYVNGIKIIEQKENC